MPLRALKTSFIARQKGLSEQDRQDLESAFSLYFDEIANDLKILLSAKLF